MTSPKNDFSMHVWLTLRRGLPRAAVPMLSTQERRGARRELKNLAKKEALSEEEQAKKLADLELKEQEELLHSQLSDTSQVCMLLVQQCVAPWLPLFYAFALGCRTRVYFFLVLGSLFCGTLWQR